VQVDGAGASGPRRPPAGAVRLRPRRFLSSQGKHLRRSNVTEEQMKNMSMLSAEPPAWADLYQDPDMVKKFPYLPVLKEGLLAAKPRPITPYYQEVTSAIEEDAYAALQGQKSPDQAINDMTTKLNDIAAQGG
jgi:multiple sugar transport system substrate-binding protein